MDVRSTGTSTAATGQVWAVLSAVEAWPDWLTTVTAVERLDVSGGGAAKNGAAVGVGSTFAVTQPRLGRATWVVTEWDPGRGFTWVSRRPGVETTGTHRVRPEGSGTVIELGITWKGPVSWLARALYGRLTRRYTQTELRSLAATSEAGLPA